MHFLKVKTSTIPKFIWSEFEASAVWISQIKWVSFTITAFLVQMREFDSKNTVTFEDNHLVCLTEMAEVSYELCPPSLTLKWLYLFADSTDFRNSHSDKKCFQCVLVC